jgi:3-deoxy-7-phosphoheptulonate synthase
MESIIFAVRESPAAQQPVWHDPERAQRAYRALSIRSPLVRAADVRALRSLLARVARGEAYVAQCGDCAESPDQCAEADVARKIALLDLVAGALKLAGNRPVVRVGRIAGQFAKPRSQDSERTASGILPAYRGHLINRPEPTARHRRHDCTNLLTCHAAARDVMHHLGWRGGAQRFPFDAAVWTSHEALLLDYELPQLRRDAHGSLLTSTHWPWIGERTRQATGAHVALLAKVDNPVACKISGDIAIGELLDLCARLDPLRQPGRLTLISRMGATAVEYRLPPLVEAVRAAGHPVIWLCDPMHGNTVTTPDGLKTRYLDTIIHEIAGFQVAVRESGGIPAGLHLETTPDDVTECVPNESAIDQVAHKYTTLCDPRLNPQQAFLVASAWQG